MSKKQGPESSQTQAAPARADRLAPSSSSSSPSSPDKGDKGDKTGKGGASRPAQVGGGGIGARLRAFREYFILSRAELRKVSWPTWKETRATSLVVLGFVVVMAILLGLVDLVLSGAVRFILS